MEQAGSLCLALVPIMAERKEWRAGEGFTYTMEVEVGKCIQQLSPGPDPVDTADRDVTRSGGGCCTKRPAVRLRGAQLQSLHSFQGLWLRLAAGWRSCRGVEALMTMWVAEDLVRESSHFSVVPDARCSALSQAGGTRVPSPRPSTRPDTCDRSKHWMEVCW